MAVPLPSPVPQCPPNTRPRRSGGRKQDQEAGSQERLCTRQIIYSCVLSAAVVFRLHIYFYILLCHTWFLGAVEK